MTHWGNKMNDLMTIYQKILGIRLNEFTTYLRAYDVESLKKLPFNKLTANGYSLGVKIRDFPTLLKQTVDWIKSDPFQ